MTPVEFLNYLFFRPETEAIRADKAISAIARARALSAQRTDEDKELTATADFPGYLVRTITGRNIFVPFNIASVFPGARILESVIPIAASVSLNAEGPICLSGSATFLGAKIPISDLDFCEYYSANDEIIFPTVESKIESKSVTFVGMKLSSEHYRYPWDSLIAKAREVRFCDVAKLKFEYVSYDGSIGIIPTTSVVITTGSDYVTIGTNLSYVYQEAVITSGEPPWSLFKHKALLDYVSFLSEQIAYYRTSMSNNDSPLSAIKAIKRAISLLLIIGADYDPDLREELNAAVAFLTTPQIGGIVARFRLEELEAMAEVASPADRIRVSEEIRNLRLMFSDLIPDGREFEDVRDRAASYAEAMDEAMTELFGAAGVLRKNEHAED